MEVHDQDLALAPLVEPSDIVEVLIFELATPRLLEDFEPVEVVVLGVGAGELYCDAAFFQVLLEVLATEGEEAVDVGLALGGNDVPDEEELALAHVKVRLGEHRLVDQLGGQQLVVL